MNRVDRMTESFEASFERDKKSWEAEHRIGVVCYDPEVETIAFLKKPDDDLEDYRYWFPVDYVDTHEKYKNWFEHMSHKQWFTKEVSWQLQDVLERLGYNGNPDE